jgi:ubiquitin carboxyl-terminal hydrolase 7
VHDGSINSGVYSAFVRPTEDGQFYKFLDDRVTLASRKEVFNDNFGGKDTNQAEKTKSAYILTYARKSTLDQVLGRTTNDDLPKHLANFGTTRPIAML